MSDKKSNPTPKPQPKPKHIPLKRESPPPNTKGMPRRPKPPTKK